jgi:hypothetical protein
LQIKVLKGHVSVVKGGIQPAIKSVDKKYARYSPNEDVEDVITKLINSSDT